MIHFGILLAKDAPIDQKLYKGSEASKSGVSMRMVVVLLVAAMLLVSSFAGVVTAESEEEIGPYNPIFEDMTGINDSKNPGTDPLGESPPDIGGGNPR